MPNCCKCPPRGTLSSSFGHCALLMTHKFLNHVVLGRPLRIITPFRENAPFFSRVSRHVTNMASAFPSQCSMRSACAKKPILTIEPIDHRNCEVRGPPEHLSTQSASWCQKHISKQGTTIANPQRWGKPKGLEEREKTFLCFFLSYNGDKCLF